MNILAVIPARSGSKSIEHKNIRRIAGKPMLAYSIEHAISSKWINRIVLSTDSEQYADIGREFGAEIPFIRPRELAEDHSLDLDVFRHCLGFLKEKEGYEAEIVVHLRPTYPMRSIQDLDTMIEMLIKNEMADSVRSVAPAKEIPHKMWKKDSTGYLHPMVSDIPECYNLPRQELPQAYYQNACIDVTRGSVIMEKQSMTGTNILGFEMKQNFDIDMEEDLKAVELMLGKKRFVFDIDGVIAQLEERNHYEIAEPNIPMIHVINKLFDAGNEIILLTARGYVSGIDWRQTTEDQLNRWGLRYHELHFGKPNADYYIDDKMLDMRILLEKLC